MGGRTQRLPFNQLVRDIITGFEGVVTGYAQYITGCDQYLVQPEMSESQVEEGKKPDAYWFDDHRLELIEERVPFAPAGGQKDDKDKGADAPAPVK